MNTIVSLMCHPQNAPAIALQGLRFFVNLTPGYGNAVRYAIGTALDLDADLIIADSDGYHPPSEISRLAGLSFPDAPSMLIKPYRNNIGFQSKNYSLLYSLVKFKHIRDATGGLYRMNNRFMRDLPALKARDMTVNIEILSHAIQSDASIMQYGYDPGQNNRAISKRTNQYQFKLLKALLWA